MPFEPLKFLINQVKTTVGNLSNLRPPQPDVVTALNAHTDQIANLSVCYYVGDTSLDTIKTNLLTVARSMVDSNSESKLVRLLCNFTSDYFANGMTYVGYLKIVAASSSWLYFEANLSSNLGDNVIIGYNNGTWIINNLTNQIGDLMTRENVSLTITPIDSRVTNITYHELIRCGFIGCLFVTFTATADIPAWTSLFQIENTIARPKFVQRMATTNGALLYILTDGIISSQNSIPTESNNIVATYILKGV